MFFLKKDDLKLAKIQLEALKIICNSNELYDEVLTRSNEVSVHQKHALWLQKYVRVSQVLIQIL